MILEKLCEFSKRVDDFPPLHFTRRSVDWLIEIDKEGNFIEFVNVSEEGNIYLYSKNLIGRSGRAVKPLLLGDKAKYIFGRLDEKELSKREKKLKQSFCELTKECFEETENIYVKSTIDFLAKYKFCDLKTDKEIGLNDWMLFRVENEKPLTLQSIQEFWQNIQNNEAKERSDMISECLVCGRKKAIADRHTVKLKLSKIGGHGRGNPLISANVEAFESFGLEESRIAPLCFDCVTLYGRTANYLIDSENNNLKVGDLLYLFWTKTNREFNGFNILSNPTSEKVKSFIQSVYKGQSGEINEEEFYVLSISANSSRAVVRDWIQTMLKDIENNIVSFFDSMELEDGRENEYYSVNGLARQTAQDYDDIKPTVAASIMSYALKGTPLSTVVIFNVVKRIKADVDFRVTRPRAALIKMYFESNSKGGISVKKKLDRTNQNSAYLCGRLFSLIEKIQKTALPGIKSTIVDRYYGTASAAPASVFGNLLRKAQHHLANLRKNESKKGLYFWLQGELEDVMQDLDDFPSSLSLTDQSLFALGYYQQKAYKPEKEQQDEEVKNNDI